MLNDAPKKPANFAADLINAVKQNANGLSATPDGQPRDLTFEQAAVASQVMALNAVAASLLAVADAISSRKR